MLTHPDPNVRKHLAALAAERKGMPIKQRATDDTLVAIAMQKAGYKLVRVGYWTAPDKRR